MKCKDKKDCDGFATCNIIPCNAEKHSNKYRNSIRHYFVNLGIARYSIGYHNYSKTVLEFNIENILMENRFLYD